MENHPLEILENWKAVGIVAGVIIIIIVLSLLLSAIQGNRKPQPLADNQPTIGERQSVVAPTSSATAISSSASNNATNVQQFYQNYHITLDYPTDWQVEANPLEGGGETLTIKPPDISNLVGKFTMQVMPVSSAGALSIPQVLASFDLTETSQTVNGVTVSIFEGNVQLGNETYFEKALVGTYKNNMYLLKYVTPDNSDKTQLDNIFSTFHFQMQ